MIDRLELFPLKCHVSSILVCGLKCYLCAGTEKAWAKDKLERDSKKEMTCPAGMDRCMRISKENETMETDDARAVANSCTNEAGCKLAEEICDEADCKVGCCDTDLCNAGSPVSFSVFLMTVYSALGLALLK